MDLGLLYRALRGGQIDVAVGSSTDGLIAAWNLRVLEDDLRYFPPYDAAPVVRVETLERHPRLGDVLADLGGLLSEKEMQRLNHEIDGRHRAVAQVRAGAATRQGAIAVREKAAAQAIGQVARRS